MQGPTNKSMCGPRLIIEPAGVQRSYATGFAHEYLSLILAPILYLHFVDTCTLAKTII